jgi:hypothetical protein
VRPSRFTMPPRAPSRRGVKLDNVALVPASLLPFKAEWQAIANDLPRGQILIVLPWQAKPQRVAGVVAARLRMNGKHVTVMHNELQNKPL